MIPHVPPCSMHTAGLLKVGLTVRDTSVPLRAAALQLPRCVYASPSAAAVRGCGKQVMLSRPETPGYEIIFQQPSVVA